MPETSTGGDDVRFHETLWSTVIRARDGAPAAMGRLIERYWKPVYFFIRRRGNDVERAKDLTQEFFARIVERGYLRTVSPERGKFRSWVLAAVGHFLSNERDRESAGRRPPLVFTPDYDAVERIPDDEPVERAFDRLWAEETFRHAKERLAQEMRREGRATPLAAFEQALGGKAHRDIAAALAITEKDVANHVARTKARLREIVLDEIGATVDDPGEAQAELAYFVGLLSS